MNEREFTYENDAGEEVTVAIPQQWEICSACAGNGKHDHPAFSNGISGQEFYGEWDEDERESYMRGAYDVRCEECDGSGKVSVDNFDALPDNVRDEVMEAVEFDQECARDFRAESRQERLMGA